ncbi:hypothetical protein BH09ACT11_BH09ACT11_02840 [soil metagenome]
MSTLVAPAFATASDRAARIRFRRALMLLVMTLVLPGSAQVVAGDRRMGWIALRTVFAVFVAGVLTGLLSMVHHQFAFWLVTTPWILNVIRFALIALAIGWAYLFVDAWRIGQPLSLLMGHRRTVVAVNLVLTLAVTATLLFSAHVVAVQRGFILSVFSGEEVVGAHDGRFNVAILGGDAGAGRWGMRPDSMTIASIDATTGKTVLIGLPRNMANFTFPRGSVMAEQFPDGFNCEGCYLNGLWTWAEDHPSLFGDTAHPGIDATLSGMEGISGLRINYWVTADLSGFKQIVDAVGGVTLNVRQPIPVGGLGDDVTGYIDPGVQKLNGFETLWYARAREGSDDYSRMARQKCVMNALLGQVSPQQVLTNFQKIADAGSAMLQTSIPAGEVDRFIDLALKAKGQKISTLSLVPPLVPNTADPNIAQIHAKVTAAVKPAAGQKAPSPKTGGVPKDLDTVTGGSLGSLSGGYQANQTADLSRAC